MSWRKSDGRYTGTTTYEDWWSSSDSSDAPPPAAECNPSQRWTRAEWIEHNYYALEEVYRAMLQRGRECVGSAFMQHATFLQWAEFVFDLSLLTF